KDETMREATTDWLLQLKPNIKKFLDEMSLNNYSYFKYSYTGDLLDQTKNWGLANIVFAVKTLYITGLLDEISENQKNNLYQTIIRFSSKNGYIHDPYLIKLSIKQKIRQLLGKLDKKIIENIEDTKRAETRQSFAALYLLSKKPIRRYQNIPYTKEGIKQYLSSFDWSKPWHAGSHFSILLFFLQMNSVFFNYWEEQKNELIQYAIKWINQLQSKKDGCWYQGENVSLQEKINGAMKIFTGLHPCNIYDIQYPEKIVDTALAGINDQEACSNFNIVYVLYSCNKIIPDYRKDEIVEFLYNRLDLYKKFYYPELGGFSFYEKKANPVYLKKRITLGKNEPDIHGTCLFVWGLSIINQMMDLGINFRVPLN
ncbi:MAG: hypothetical protein MJB14_17160, partial [Spirochaetes bacterium]|nr:hypothetical protein [Spirochaetota bacterium]